LAKLVRADNSIEEGEHGLAYPLYTSALAVSFLSRFEPEKYRQARDAWLKYLRARQLTEELGWEPADRPYGGWGYCPLVPRKPRPGEAGFALLESNLSATVFALSALRQAGVARDDPAYRKAVVFVERCQNYRDKPDPRFDDGGFHFIYADPVRNKAGVAGEDAAGQPRFHSYGSMTSDGLLALLLCGKKGNEPRVRSARDWLLQHFSAERHPGRYVERHEPARDAVYFYYVWSLEQTLAELERQGEQAIPIAAWRTAIGRNLTNRQKADGSWANEQTLVREDDPVLATSLAVGSLARLNARLVAQVDIEMPMPEGWDYVPSMKKVAAKFRGTEGVVIHVGGSMTIANPYGTWGRIGKGKTEADTAILEWMHTEKRDKTDGWWLCRTELVMYRAYTSESGLKSAMLFAGGRRGLPTLAKILDEYQPRMVTIECGIYDVEDGVPLEDYRKNMAKALDSILDRGAIPLLNTIPPFQAQLDRTKQFNAALRELAKERGVPLIDLEREILTRRPDDWFGTLMKRIHLTASEAGGNSGAEPTAENLKKSGYQLRGWLTVRKIAEVKRRVLD
jgi:hypothetical protein